jgi:hypothetical protein
MSFVHGISSNLTFARPASGHEDLEHLSGHVRYPQDCAYMDLHVVLMRMCTERWLRSFASSSSMTTSTRMWTRSPTTVSRIAGSRACVSFHPWTFHLRCAPATSQHFAFCSASPSGSIRVGAGRFPRSSRISSSVQRWRAAAWASQGRRLKSVAAPSWRIVGLGASAPTRYATYRARNIWYES